MSAASKRAPGQPGSWAASDDDKTKQGKQNKVVRKQKKAYSTSTSRVVPHHSTTLAAQSLTSRFGWDVVYSPSYGRRRKMMWCCGIRGCMYCMTHMCPVCFSSYIQAVFNWLVTASVGGDGGGVVTCGGGGGGGHCRQACRNHAMRPFT